MKYFKSHRKESDKTLELKEIAMIHYSTYVYSRKDPIEEIEEKEMKAAVHKLLSQLTERERVVLKMRFGLDDYDESTLNEISNEFGFSKQNARRIECIAYRKCRHLKNAWLMESLPTFYKVWHKYEVIRKRLQREQDREYDRKYWEQIREIERERRREQEEEEHQKYWEQQRQ